MRVQSVSFSEACGFVNMHHRHHRAGRQLSGHPGIPGHMFSLALVSGEILQVTEGVAIIGRPIARKLPQDGSVLEVTRLCTLGQRNACSMLYGAAWREARKRGAITLITYTLASEGGHSVRASNGRECGRSPGRPWNGRSRVTNMRALGEKIRWCWGTELGGGQ